MVLWVLAMCPAEAWLAPSNPHDCTVPSRCDWRHVAARGARRCCQVHVFIYWTFTEHLLCARCCAKCPGDKAVSAEAKVWIRPIWHQCPGGSHHSRLCLGCRVTTYGVVDAGQRAWWLLLLWRCQRIRFYRFMSRSLSRVFWLCLRWAIELLFPGRSSSLCDPRQRPWDGPLSLWCFFFCWWRFFVFLL